jgi:hypothetical protein
MSHKYGIKNDTLWKAVIFDAKKIYTVKEYKSIHIA